MENPETALSDTDIQAFLSSSFHNMEDFVTDLNKIKSSNYDEKIVFGPNRHSRIVFLENPNSEIGHFCLLTDCGNCYEFFDPVGNDPPTEIWDLARLNGKYLITLKKESRLQDESTYVCGKWCILRYLSLPTTLDDFVEIFIGKKKENPDSVVNKLIQIKKYE